MVRLSPRQLQAAFRICLDVFSSDSRVERKERDAKTIEADYILAGRKIGSAVLRLSDHKLLFSGFHPHKELDEDGYEYPLARCGVGTLAYVSTLLKVAEDFSPTSSCVVRHASPSDSSRLHLNAMGIPIRELKEISPSLSNCLDACIDYANSKGFDFYNPFD